MLSTQTWLCWKLTAGQAAHALRARGLHVLLLLLVVSLVQRVRLQGLPEPNPSAIAVLDSSGVQEVASYCLQHHASSGSSMHADDLRLSVGGQRAAARAGAAQAGAQESQRATLA